MKHMFYLFKYMYESGMKHILFKIVCVCVREKC